MASTNKRKSASSRGRKKAAKKQAAPIRREVGAIVCLVLALLAILCCFKVNAAFLNLLSSLFKGLIGAGFYILPFSFVMSFLILILHDGRPVALRVTCTFLTAALIGSLVQLVGGQFEAVWDWSVIPALWDSGIDGTAGRRPGTSLERVAGVRIPSRSCRHGSRRGTVSADVRGGAARRRQVLLRLHPVSPAVGTILDLTGTRDEFDLDVG